MIQRGSSVRIKEAVTIPMTDIPKSMRFDIVIRAGTMGVVQEESAGPKDLMTTPTWNVLFNVNEKISYIIPVSEINLKEYLRIGDHYEPI